MLTEDVKRWDVYHKKTYQQSLVHSKYAEEKEVLFPRNSIIVDLGGGVGADAIYFLKKGHSVIILDISEFAMKIANEKAKEEKVEKRLITRQVDFSFHQIPIKPESCDIAYSRISLNYFGKDHTTKLYVDIYNLLKSGGKAYLTFKSPDDQQETEYLKTKAVVYEENVYIQNGQLRSRFTIAQHKEMLVNAGIPKFEVKPYLEELRGEDLSRKTLPLVEIIISKD